MEPNKQQQQPKTTTTTTSAGTSTPAGAKNTKTSAAMLPAGAQQRSQDEAMVNRPSTSRLIIKPKRMQTGGGKGATPTKPSSSGAGGHGRGMLLATSTCSTKAPKDAGMAKGSAKVSPVEDGDNKPNLQRRKAYNILKYQANHPEKATSSKWLKDVAWAKTIIPDFSLGKANTKEDTAKRNRSIDKGVEKAPKRQRVNPAISFAEVTRGKRLIAVIDRNDPEGRIPRDQWKYVVSAVTGVCMDVVNENPGDFPSCTDAGWYQGAVKVIACDNDRSAELYKAAVAKIGEVYAGAKLEVCEAADIPCRPRARVWLPDKPSNPESILALLKGGNKDLPTDSWKVIRVEEENKASRHVLLQIDKVSAEALCKRGGRVRYGFGYVNLHVYKNDLNSRITDHIEPPNEEEEMEMEAGDEEKNSGYTSSESELRSSFQRLYSEQDLLDEDEDGDATITEGSQTLDEGSADKPSS